MSPEIKAAQARRIRNVLVAVVFMVVGSTSALGMVVAMNEFSEPLMDRELAGATELELTPPPRPKARPTVDKPKPKPRKAPRTPPAPALAALASGLSGIAVDIPALQLGDLTAGAKDLLGTDDEVTYTADTVDNPPRPTRQAALQYPARLRQKGVEGYVELGFFVTASGEVESVRVLDSQPPDVFDEAVLEGFRGWAWQPAEYEGKPVRIWTTKRFTFSLTR